ncbi:MAG: hypothetical protein HQL49_12570 [Gammaproteobacteria bacterium]|nr:hypothetical protein [Gammaproteobacteria bacterium]
MNVEQVLPMVQQLRHHEKLELVHRLINLIDEESQQSEQVVANPDKEPNGAKIAKLMAEIAARGTAFQDIDDPVAWQREIRKDRPLPGRE